MSQAVPGEPFNWPPYFQPAPGQERFPSSDPVRLPVDLVDVFSLREPAGSGTAIVAVARCLGGGLSVFTGESLQRLEEQEPDLARQLQAVSVAHRGAFRVITASELFFCTLDALKQDVQVTGFNDPLDLHGTMQARIAWGGEEFSLTVLDNEGRFTVGRLDFLTGYRLGAPHAFENPGRESGRVYPFPLPLAPTEEIERGNSLALAYALLDPQDSPQVDNTVLVLSFVHSVLTRLQHDLGRARSGESLATRPLPVPNRRQIEEELELDGYEIIANMAVKRSVARGPATNRSGLRRLLDALGIDQAASRVGLPAQATPNDYEQLIGEFVAAVATPEDHRMFNALAHCFDERVRARSMPAANPRQPIPSGSTGRQPVQPDEPPSSPSSSRLKQAPEKPKVRRDQRDFSADFEPSTQPATPSNRNEWTGDFAREVREDEVADQASMADDFASPSRASRRDGRAHPDRLTSDFDPPDA